MKKKWTILCAAAVFACGLSGCQPGRQTICRLDRSELGTQFWEIPALEESVEDPEQSEKAPEQPTVFRDAEFVKAVCSSLDIPEDMPEEELLEIFSEIERLEISREPEAPVETLADLAYLPKLVQLDISFYGLSDLLPGDLSGIEEARELETIYLDYVKLEDLSFAARLPKLKELYLVHCGLTDISGLEAAAGLERLSLFGNSISDAAVLGSLTELVELSISENGTKLKNADSLGLLTKMEDMGLTDCGLENIEFVRGMPGLRALNVNQNNISDLSPLEGHEPMERLGFRSNRVTDISVLKGLPKLYDLAMDDNGIEDISVLAGLKELSELGISDNPITDISALGGLDKLFSVNLGRNPVKDITPLLHVPFPTFYSSQEYPAGEDIPWEETAHGWIRENRADLKAYTLEDACMGDLNRDGIRDLAFVYSELYNESDAYEEEEASEEQPEEQGAADGQPEAAGEDGAADEKPEAPEEGAAAERTAQEPGNGRSPESAPLYIERNEVWDTDFRYEDRVVVILLGRRDGSYRQLETDLNVMGYVNGGMRGDPYRGIFMADGYLALQQAWGSRSGATETKFFKYRKGKLEEAGINVVGDDNFAYGYDVWLTQYPSGRTTHIAYAVDPDYRLVRIPLKGLEDLTGAPQIDLYNGNYFYFEEPRKSELSPSEALDLAAAGLAGVLEELEENVEEPLEAVREEIGYTPELKKNLELLKGVSLPDYYYRCGEGEESEIILYYNMFGSKEENRLHVICISYWNTKYGDRREREVLVNDADQTVSVYH